MNTLETILLAIGLAMDCFTVSIAGTIQCKNRCWRKTLRMALFFGFFQGAMPILSWLAGVGFKDYIQQFDHWIAFFILCYIGIRMIVESVKKENDAPTQTPFDSLKMLLLMSIATSIDALATGIIFIPFGRQIWTAVPIIAATSFLFSLAGVFIGSHFRKKFRFNVEIVGGIILICIGAKILIEHCLC